jgi:histone H3/H4
MTKSLIVRVQAKDATMQAGIPNVSEDFYIELEKKAKQLIIDACERAKKNKRTTVMGKDV